MGTIQVSELLSYVVPLLVASTAWIINKIIGLEKDIAVNSSKDSVVTEQFGEIKADIKALSKELHDFILSQSNKING